MRAMWTRVLTAGLLLAVPDAGLLAEGRMILPLDGQWQIADSVAGEVPPTVFAHTVPVPGLVHLAHPAFAVAIRRMHDVDKSGWFIWVPIYNLILACSSGTPGPNRFGPDPLGGMGGAQWQQGMHGFGGHVD